MALEKWVAKHVAKDDPTWKGKPFVVAVGGKRWLCAVDGFEVAAIPSHGKPTAEISKTTARAIRALLTFESQHAVRTEVHKIVDWCGVETFTKCIECDGKGKTQSCAACGHKVRCSRCNGVRFARTLRKASIAGNVLDLDSVRDGISGLPPSASCRVFRENKSTNSAVAFVSDGWRYVRMPMNATPTEPSYEAWLKGGVSP